MSGNTECGGGATAVLDNWEEMDDTDVSRYFSGRMVHGPNDTMDCEWLLLCVCVIDVVYV